MTFIIFMYGKLPQRKMTKQDHLLDCHLVREEMADYINEDNRRVNIDSAKKKAVLQRFDYEGFRQMVLGANLFSLKTKQLMAFSQGDERSQLSISETLPLKQSIKSTEVIEDKEILEKLLNKNLTSELACLTFQDFKKWMDRFYSQPMTAESSERIIYLIKSQKEERLEKVFGSEFDSKYFTRIIKALHLAKETVFLPQKMGYQVAFILHFFDRILSLKRFKMALSLLLPKQKKAAVNFFQGLEECFEGEDAGEQIKGKISWIVKQIG